MPSKNDQQRLYKDLAEFFPVITPPEDYIEETEYFTQIIKHTSLIDAKTVLNLGCGAGNNDFTLKKHFSVVGVDVSRDMLKIAKKLNPKVTYVKGDMRMIRIKKKFDVVTAFDAINYMTTLDDLRAAFGTAYHHLKPGGVFITILEETPESFVQNMTRTSIHAKGGKEVVFIENLYDPDPKDSTYELTLTYLIRKNGALKIETDRHLCGIFQMDTWFDLLQEAGFKVNRLDFNVTDPEARSYPLLLCIKPKD